jgi:hypothetical protein
MRKQSQYALYKGDTYLYGGTREELAKFLGVKVRTIRFYYSPTYMERIKDKKDRYYVIKVEDL